MNEVLLELYNKLLAPSNEIQKATLEEIDEYQNEPNFLSETLKIVADDEIDLKVRLTAISTFNTIADRRWKVGEDEDKSEINDEDKEIIRQAIVPLIFSLEPQLRTQLEESLTIIALNDYPKDFPDLFTQIKTHLEQEGESLEMVNAILGCLNRFFKEFPLFDQSNDLLDTIDKVCDDFGEFYLNYFVKYSQTCVNEAESIIGTNNEPQYFGNVENKDFLKCLQYLYDFFCYLNSHNFTKFFKDNMETFVEVFQAILDVEDPDMDEFEIIPSLVSNLKISSLRALTLMVKHGDVLDESQIFNILSTSWELFSNIPMVSRFDPLRFIVVDFLVSIINKKMADVFFQNDVFSNLFQSIIMPLLYPTDNEIDDFGHSPLQQIDADVHMVGSTKKAKVFGLIRSLLREGGDENLSSFEEAIAFMAEQITEDEENKDKHLIALTTLYMACSAKSLTDSTGCLVVHSNFDVSQFFNAYIDPILNNTEKSMGKKIDSSTSMVYCSLLQFVLMFRVHFEEDILLKLPTILVELLKTNDDMILSYVSLTLTEILNSRDNTLLIGYTQLINSDYDLIGHIFKQLCPKILHITKEQFPNHYLLNILSKLSSILMPELMVQLIEEKVVMSFLKEAFIQIYDKPIASTYILHYFELLIGCLNCLNFNSLGDLQLYSKIGDSLEAGEVNCENAKKKLIDMIETDLFEYFGNILQDLERELLVPYIFQVICAILKGYQIPVAGLPENYVEFMKIIINSEEYWKDKNMVVSLVTSLATFIELLSENIEEEYPDLLKAVEERFKQLMSKKSTDHIAVLLFYLIIQNLTLESLSSIIVAIFSKCLTRLKKSETHKVSVGITHIFSMFIFKFGVENFIQVFENINSGLAINFISKKFPSLLECWTSHSPCLNVVVISTIQLLNYLKENSLVDEDVWYKIFENLILLVVGNVTFHSDKKKKYNLKLSHHGIVKVSRTTIEPDFYKDFEDIIEIGQFEKEQLLLHFANLWDVDGDRLSQDSTDALVRLNQRLTNE
eukprot:TRINITY_DN3193_c4_g3_i1.p1 TRINITY_DN3193_c4_g3~~TRINITY_DN3193_c4_g3_i1.p1  ORF type:complete len:1028 (+),score=334.07 TRINITY_DN3193_c4_g3_i1:43-3084(+)